MKFTDLLGNHPEAFIEAINDLDKKLLAELLDEKDYLGVYQHLAYVLGSMKDTIEDELEMTESNPAKEALSLSRRQDIRDYERYR